MDKKMGVLTGLVLTALFTSLILWQVIPSVAAAFLFLGLGLMLTYYIALNQRRVCYISDLKMLARAMDKIKQESNGEGAIRQLIFGASRLFPAQKAWCWFEAGGLFPPEPEYRDGFWENAAGVVLRTGAVTPVHSSEECFKGLVWPEGIPSFWATAVHSEGGKNGVLFLTGANLKQLSAVELEMLSALAAETGAVIKREQELLNQEQEWNEAAGILLRSLEAREAGFTGHARRVSLLALRLGRQLKLDPDEMKVLKYAALLHDVGRGMKPPEENDGEDGGKRFDHAVAGADLLPPDEFWSRVGEGIRYHHERYDGSGEPEGLKQTEIPFTARIIAVADVYDALTRISPEEERMTSREAVATIKKATGIFFDPLVVVVLEEGMEQGWDILADRPEECSLP